MLHCHDLVPDHRPPHTVLHQQQARCPCHFLCLWLGMQHQASMCKSGADTQPRFAQPRATPRPLTRSQKIRISADIRSVALPSSAVSRALARNTPSCGGHLNGHLPCMTLRTDDRAMQIPFLCVAQVKPVRYVGRDSRCHTAERRSCTYCEIADFDR